MGNWGRESMSCDDDDDTLPRGRGEKATGRVSLSLSLGGWAKVSGPRSRYALYIYIRTKREGLCRVKITYSRGSPTGLCTLYAGVMATLFLNLSRGFPIHREHAFTVGNVGLRRLRGFSLSLLLARDGLIQPLSRGELSHSLIAQRVGGIYSR